MGPQIGPSGFRRASDGAARSRVVRTPGKLIEFIGVQYYWDEINHGWRSIDALVALAWIVPAYRSDDSPHEIGVHRPGTAIIVSRDPADRQSSGDTGELGVWLRTVGRLSRHLGLQRQYHNVGQGKSRSGGLRGEFAATGIAWDLGRVLPERPRRLMSSPSSV